ncbi:tripartite motif containing 36 [Homo sapiens]|nr:E3 ubiquitin-protein ligase TRIM36 isoform 3 [Homo sapiens]KAI2538487.1 tripartite motif containing 36 [Homo sapiens]KAI4022259.1 tripartite motif containing 36 [Homo sapiens]|eukprot:NP_001017398.1 E3 ubiquitin-protein ligase TRIM36 isoform 3 [Homo sapiens]
MSESGEMSEFGYIMELIAKGKASAMGLQQTHEHSRLTSKGGEARCPFEISEVGKQSLPRRT